jgi:hypothetical protein
MGNGKGSSGVLTGWDFAAILLANESLWGTA